MDVHANARTCTHKNSNTQAYAHALAHTYLHTYLHTHKHTHAHRYAVKAKPEHINGLMNLGLNQLAMHEWEKAFYTFDTAVG